MRFWLAVLVVLGWAGEAQAAVRLKHENPYPETPVQACLRVDGFSFDRQPDADKGGYLLGWKLNLKSTCLKHNDVKIFYELADRQGNDLSYRPLGSVTGHVGAGARVEVGDTVRLEEDPMGLQLKFHALTTKDGKRIEDFPLYAAMLKQAYVPDPVVDEVAEKKAELVQCFQDFAVKDRAIAENWRVTHVWWQVNHPEKPACRQPVYVQLFIRDKEGKELERSEPFVEHFDHLNREGVWHTEQIRTRDYTDAARLEITVAYEKNDAATIFKTLVLTPPELENW